MQSHPTTSTTELHSRVFFKFGCTVLFFLAAAASFNGFYDKYRLLDVDEFGNLHSRITFERFIDGTADRPFIYRQMLLNIANWADVHVSAERKDQLFHRYIHTGSPIGRDPYDSPVLHDERYFFRYTLIYVMVFLFAWLSVHSMYFVATASGCSPPASAIAAIGMILLVPYFEINAGFYYDYPELFFFSLIVGMAIRTSWWWLIPIAALGTWNKESFLLFVPSLYPLIRLRLTRNRALLATAVLLLGCASVYLPIHYVYRFNQGATVETHIHDQLTSIFHPEKLFTREWTYGLLAFWGPNVVTLLLGVWTVVRGWPLLDRALKTFTLIALAINLPSFILFCAMFELRDLSMLYVSLVILIGAVLTPWTQTPSLREGDTRRVDGKNLPPKGCV